MIPLINIVFLILILFMIAGRIEPPEVLEIAPPRSLQGQVAEPAPILVLASADGRLAVDGEPVDAQGLSAALALRLAARGGRDGGPPRIALKADRALSAGQLRALLLGLRALGVERVGLIAQGRQ